MKFPLPRNLFPPVELSSEQEDMYERLANSVIRETLAEYDAFVSDQGRRVDPVRWKQVKRRDEVSIYRERASNGATRSLSTPNGGVHLHRSSLDSFDGSLASSAGPKTTSGSSSYSLGHTIRMPDTDPLASPNSFGDRLSADSGVFGRTIGLPSSRGPASVFSDGHAASSSRFSSSSRSGSMAGALPRLLAVGTIRGSLDDVMYGVVTPNASTARLRSSYLDDDIADCAVLAELIAPSASEPFRFLGLKWLVKENRRAAALVWPRDFVVLEHSGVMLRPDGARVGFHLMHSVDVPAVRELTDRRILRAKLSSCYIYEERHAGRVDVYMSAHVQPRGLVLERMALRSAAKALSSCWRSVDCAQSKKLAFYLQNERHSQLPAPARPVVTPSTMPVLEAAHNGRSCGVCHAKFGLLNRVVACQLCCELVCYRCRTVRKLSSQLVDAMVTKTAIVFCKRCVSSVNDESALDVAAREMWDSRRTSAASNRPRSSSASSYLIARSSQPSERARRSRGDSFSSERDTYSSVVLGQHSASDLESRRSGASSTRSSDRRPPPSMFARQSSLGSLGSVSRSSAARVKRASFSLSGPRFQNTGSTETLSIADLDGSEAGDDRDSVVMARGDDPVMLDDSLTKIQHVDFVDMPSKGDDEAMIVSPGRQTQPALVRLYDAEDEAASPPVEYTRSPTVKVAVDYEFRMSELDHDPASPVKSVHDDLEEAIKEVEAVEAVEASPSMAEDVLSISMFNSEAAPAVHSSAEPRSRAHTTAPGAPVPVEELLVEAAPTGRSSAEVEAEKASRFRSHTMATPAASGPGGGYQSQLWRQMNELHSVVESTYQVAKANTELAKAATAAAERPRNFRTYSQFGFNVVGLRPARAMTTLPTASPGASA